MANKPTPQEAPIGETSGEGRRGAEVAGVDSARGLPLEPGARSDDPYNKALEQTTPAKRCLDDMRQLSDTIKAAPAWTPPKKTTALYQQLEVLRADLECTLTKLQAVYAEALLCADQRAAKALIEQLKNAADSIENALDELMPPRD